MLGPAMRKRFFLPAAPTGAASPLPFAADAPWLAPLAGYSDLPFRLLCRHYGAAVCVTEMVSAKGLIYKSPGTGELLMSLPEDQPLVVQLFGAEPEVLAEAVRTAYGRCAEAAGGFAAFGRSRKYRDCHRAQPGCHQVRGPHH